RSTAPQDPAAPTVKDPAVDRASPAPTAGRHPAEEAADEVVAPGEEPTPGEPTRTSAETRLSRAAVRQRVSTRSAELDACLRGSPSIAARMMIDASGRVARIDLDGASPMVELCVRDVLGAIEFPAADRRSTH